LLRALGNPPLEIVLWNGEAIGGGPPLARVVLRDRLTLWKLFLRPAMHFGDAYTAGRLEVEGDLAKMLEAAYRAEPPQGFGPLRRVLGRWLRKARSNTLAGSRANIHHHYDIGDDFYRLWLDEQMLYTCAYFPTPTVTLEAAQRAKMDYVCRKVWLRPGETVVEAGCGWGALALHMARHYGVTVKAYNVSREQTAYARRRAGAEGLDGRVQFIDDDYRNIRGRFDVFVSVGMLEHVGLDHHGEFAAAVDRSLGRAGRGLIHFIGRDRPGWVNPWIERRIFPGAYAPTLREVTAFLEPPGFSVLDVENLGLHYAETLRHWLLRFDADAGRVARMFDETFVRAWRLYLTGSMAAFNSGSLQLFQLVLARSGSSDIPRTRARLYAE
jgi:cyclopropane-fatty-acyl-phospholipid synthase